MIDCASERMIALREVPRLLPPRAPGRRIHVATVYRWAKRGIRGAKLETLRIGGQLFTSTDALQRFVDACSSETQCRPLRTRRARMAAINRAERELEQAGI